MTASPDTEWVTGDVERRLTEKESVKGRYDRYGYVAPVRVLDEQECREVLATLRQPPQRPPLDWHKGLATTSPEHWALATHERILELVVTLLGKDAILWAMALRTRKAGQVHFWHTDIETSAPSAKALSIWIGLERTSARSSLKVVPGSHRFGITVQQVMQEERKPREQVLDDDVTRWARERDTRSGVVPLSTTDGEAVVFDGRLWHGSHNETDSTRQAVLLQYATPDTPIRIPSDRVTWPFELYENPKPPCILVSGHTNSEINRIVPPPVASNLGAPPTLTCRIHSLPLPLERDFKVGWKPHYLFRGSTAGIAWMQCHVAVLEPGHQPHSPHQHDEEEILIVLDGTADLVLQNGDGSPATSRHRSERGAFAFYPTGYFHTISNPSDAPLTYLMFKWKNGHRLMAGALLHQLISASDGLETLNTTDGDGFRTKPLLDGRSEYLRKLSVHVTVVEPGSSGEPRRNAHDIAIVLFEGEVETMGQRVSAPGVTFHSAGESYNIKNVGGARAVYLAIEFHGKSAEAVPSVVPRLS